VTRESQGVCTLAPAAAYKRRRMSAATARRNGFGFYQRRLIAKPKLCRMACAQVAIGHASPCYHLRRPIWYQTEHTCIRCLPQVSRVFEVAEHDSHMCVLDVVLLLEVVGDDRAKVGKGGRGRAAVWPGWMEREFARCPVLAAAIKNNYFQSPHTRLPRPSLSPVPSAAPVPNQLVEKHRSAAGAVLGRMYSVPWAPAKDVQGWGSTDRPI
jgi:hypothetical protein